MSTAAAATPAPAAPQTPAAEKAPETPQLSVVTEADEIAKALEAVEKDGEPQTTEAKAETKGEGDKTEDKPEQPAKGWAAVRRVEQKLLKKRKELDAEREQFAAQMAKAQETQRQYEQRLRELDENPVEYFTKKGVTFDDLANRYLKDGKPSPAEIARRESLSVQEALKQQTAQVAELKAIIEKREVESHLNSYRADIKATLATDEFELLRSDPDAEAEVFEFADKWAAKTKEVLTPRAAALKLQEALRKQLLSLSSHQVVRNLLAGAQKQAVPGQSQVPSKAGASPKTLTNNFAATPAAGEPDFDSLTEEEQIQAALRLVQDA